MKQVPDTRIQTVNDVPVNGRGDFVLYWMIASRRATSNFALQRAVEWGRELHKPVVVLEALRSGYRWASDRLHRFIIDGMADNERAFADKSVLYYPYVEPSADAGKGLLEALSKRAAVVVTDEFPCFMLPRMVAAAAQQVTVRMETVDGNGLVPLRAAAGRVYPTAFAFRRFVHQTLPDHIGAIPKKSPLRGIDLPALRGLPREITRRWPRASKRLLAGQGDELASIPIDHAVPPVPYRGGSQAASNRLRRFLSRNLDRYADERNEVDKTPTSGLSAYLHFGHVSAHEIFARIAAREEWNPGKTFAKAISRRRGWWGMSPSAEAFLDQLVTWRELGYNMTFHRKDYDRYASLPPWARETLEAHEKDRRPHRYSRRDFERAKTHDELWNAAQRELLEEGMIHNYLRMLWGKKILEWSPSPRKALAVMIELNNKYGVDGRNPNSYSGIFWTLGRYDRPWGPERPIFGKIRYMSSENTARKIRVENYVQRHSQTELFG